jgi:hypothetical protein
MDEPDRFVPWQRNRKNLRDWQRRYYRIDCELLGLFDSNSPSLAVGREPSALYRKLFDVALECYANVKVFAGPVLRARNSSPRLR